MHFEIALEQGASSPAIKQLTWILQKGRFQSKYIASLTQLKKKISIRKTHWLVQGLRKVKFRQNQVSPWNTGLEEASFNFVLLLLSCSVVSDSLWSHGLQHTRLLCPSPSPGACLNSFSLSRLCHPTIFILCCSLLLPPSIFPSIRVFPNESGSLHQVTKILQFQLQHQSFQWIFRIDLLYDGLVWSPCSLRDSQESSPTPQFKSISSLVFSLLYDLTLTSIHDYWKNHSFD